MNLGLKLQKEEPERIAAAEKIAQEKAEEPDPAPVVVGKGIEIVGKIIGLGVKENEYGTRSVMTVLDDRGFKVWGTKPRALWGCDRGDRVKFIATIENSDSFDFGFFKRPSKVEALDAQSPPCSSASTTGSDSCLQYFGSSLGRF